MMALLPVSLATLGEKMTPSSHPSHLSITGSYVPDLGLEMQMAQQEKKRHARHAFWRVFIWANAVKRFCTRPVCWGTSRWRASYAITGQPSQLATRSASPRYTLLLQIESGFLSCVRC